MVTRGPPGTPEAAARTCSAADVREITTTGWELPGVKARLSVSWPVMASTRSRNRSVCDRPLRTPTIPSASTASAPTLTAVMMTGLRDTAAPTRDHRPVRAGSGRPSLGANGQNSPLPKATIAAGRTSSA